LHPLAIKARGCTAPREGRERKRQETEGEKERKKEEERTRQ